MRRAPTEPRCVRWLPCCLGSAPALLALFLPPSASLLTMALARDFSPLARGCVGVNGRSIPVHSLLACRLDRRPVHPGARRTCDAQLPIELAATCYFVIGLAMVPMAVRISAGGQRSLPHVAHLAQTAGHAFGGAGLGIRSRTAPARHLAAVYIRAVVITPGTALGQSAFAALVCTALRPLYRGGGGSSPPRPTPM